MNMRQLAKECINGTCPSPGGLVCLSHNNGVILEGYPDLRPQAAAILSLNSLKQLK